MRYKKDIFKVSILIVMRSLLQDIDVKGHNYYYWREVPRVKKGLMMIQRIHFMLSRDQLNLQKLKDLFIYLNLEDKVLLNEEGNDRS